MLTARVKKTVDPWGGEKYPIEEDKEYEVEHINMGSSYTSVTLKGVEARINSVCLEFSEDGKPKNIFKDKRYNPYL